MFAGRTTAKDIAAFAKDSARNSVVVLGPKDFPNRVVNSRDPWVVDFYAPVREHNLVTQIVLISEIKKIDNNL